MIHLYKREQIIIIYSYIVNNSYFTIFILLTKNKVKQNFYHRKYMKRTNINQCI